MHAHGIKFSIKEPKYSSTCHAKPKPAQWRTENPAPDPCPEIQKRENIKKHWCFWVPALCGKINQLGCAEVSWTFLHPQMSSGLLKWYWSLTQFFLMRFHAPDILKAVVISLPLLHLTETVSVPFGSSQEAELPSWVRPLVLGDRSTVYFMPW